MGLAKVRLGNWSPQCLLTKQAEKAEVHFVILFRYLSLVDAGPNVELCSLTVVHYKKTFAMRSASSTTIRGQRDRLVCVAGFIFWV